MDDLFARGLGDKLAASVALALEKIRSLEETVGVNLAEIEAKLNTVRRTLTRSLLPTG
jgi:ActR/RegA family two-component response regulator